MAALTLLLSNWRAALIGALVFTTGLFYLLWHHEVSAYATYRSGVESIGRAQQQRAARINAEQKAITQEVVNAYERDLAYLHAHPVGVLSRACTGSMPGVSVPTTGADANVPGAILTPDRIEADCAETVLNLNRLQLWVERQEGIDRK